MLARISLGRVGYSLPTKELLAFQMAHAKARDAVLNDLNSTFFAAYDPIIVHSRAENRAIYLRRPDLGRSVAEPQKIKHGDYDVASFLTSRAIW